MDDYGWALAGTNTIDLYQPSRSAMNAWGTKRVTIEIIRWGSVWESHSMLAGRSKYAHVRRMLKQIEDRYPRGREDEAPVIAAVALEHPAEPAVERAVAVSHPPASDGVARNPFYR